MKAIFVYKSEKLPFFIASTTFATAFVCLFITDNLLYAFVALLALLDMSFGIILSTIQKTVEYASSLIRNVFRDVIKKAQEDIVKQASVPYLTLLALAFLYITISVDSLILTFTLILAVSTFVFRVKDAQVTWLSIAFLLFTGLLYVLEYTSYANQFMESSYVFICYTSVYTILGNTKHDNEA